MRVTLITTLSVVLLSTSACAEQTEPNKSAPKDDIDIIYVSITCNQEAETYSAMPAIKTRTSMRESKNKLDQDFASRNIKLGYYVNGEFQKAGPDTHICQLGDLKFETIIANPTRGKDYCHVDEVPNKYKEFYIASKYECLVDFSEKVLILEKNKLLAEIDGYFTNRNAIEFASQKLSICDTQKKNCQDFTLELLRSAPKYFKSRKIKSN